MIKRESFLAGALWALFGIFAFVAGGLGYLWLVVM